MDDLLPSDSQIICLKVTLNECSGLRLTLTKSWLNNFWNCPSSEGEAQEDSLTLHPYRLLKSVVHEGMCILHALKVKDVDAFEQFHELGKVWECEVCFYNLIESSSKQNQKITSDWQFRYLAQ